MGSPLDEAFDDAKREKNYRNYLSPWRRRRLRSKVQKLQTKLYGVWRKQRRYDEDSKRYEKLEIQSLKLIDQISPLLDKLGYYSPDWMIQSKEKFETEL